MTTRKEMARSTASRATQSTAFRTSTETRQVLADRYGISRYAVDKIKKGLPAPRSKSGSN
jgi:hypothetical protein